MLQNVVLSAVSIGIFVMVARPLFLGVIVRLQTEIIALLVQALH